MTVTPAAASLTAPDATVQLNARVLDGNGRAMPGVAVIWTSVLPEVATVGASGLVAAAGNGTTTIAATVGAVAGTATVTVAVESGDRAALAALHAATDGPNWADDENWLGDGPLGEWRGVETDAFGRVARLDLGGRRDGETGEWVSHGLRGPIPPEIGSLSGLTSLNLRANALAGPIPAELGNLAALEELWLDGNALDGPIPRDLGSLAHLRELSLSANALAGPVPPELGALAGLEGLWLDGNRLEGPIPSELGSLAHLRGLSVSGNALSGPVPSELGGLRRLEFLYLDGNALTGVLPRGLIRIGGLVRFLFERNDGLCAPGTAEFMAWLDGIGESGGGPFCNEKDRAALAALHATAGGEGWTDSEGWRGGAALAGWHGVGTDSLGRVATLDLAGNGLAGRLPAGLGDLAALTGLRVGDNALSGRLPRTLLDLALDELDYAGTELCAPADETFRAWLDAIAVLRGTGAECAPATDREILEMLHDATGGRDWIDARNWLTDAPLGEWRGVEVDDQGRVVELRLWDNGLAGRLPPEFGDLAHLEYLRLSDNDLTGAIPPEFGGLSGLTYLALDGNTLSGQLPPELGGLPALEELRVENNDLSGPLPPELGGLASLRGLGLTGNAGMSGPLPAELASLGRLERLLAGGTGLCAPADPAFAAWLDRVHTRRVAPCAGREAPAAYLVQAVQSRAFPVPLVAGVRALLRVFPTAARAADAGVPAVRAQFFVNGRETHVEYVPGKSEAIPAKVDEGSLATSASAEIPGSVVQPGLEMVVEVDPDGTLDPALGVARRIPATGRLAVDVRALPPLELTIVPFLWAQAPDSSILDAVRGMAADPEGDALLADLRALLPVGALDVTAHEPVLSSSNDARRLMEETEAIRALEGGGGHYLGTMAGPVTGPSGTAFLPGRAGFSIPRSGTIAHELGHNLGLSHAPCGGRGRPGPVVPPPERIGGRLGLRLRARRTGASLDAGPDVVLRPPRRHQRLPLRQRAPLPAVRGARARGSGRRPDEVAPAVGRRGRRRHAVPQPGLRSRSIASAPGLGGRVHVDGPDRGAAPSSSRSTLRCPARPTATAAPRSRSSFPWSPAGRASWPASLSPAPAERSPLNDDSDLPTAHPARPAHRPSAGHSARGAAPGAGRGGRDDTVRDRAGTRDAVQPRDAGRGGVAAMTAPRGAGAKVRQSIEMDFTHRRAHVFSTARKEAAG